jgi:flagellar biosynthesis protein FlhG
MNRIVPIASGKGGVGKTVVTANIGVELAKLGKTVVLVDLDLGASNLHTCLGVRNQHAGIGAMAFGQLKNLEDAVVDTGIGGLYLIPGDGLLPGTANLEFFVKNRIVKQLSKLPADIVLLDLGAGSSYNVVDFFLLAPDGLIVSKPEITAILNSYAMLKTAVFRMLFRAFPKKSAERSRVVEFASRKLEGGGVSFIDAARDLAGEFPDTARAAFERLAAFKPRFAINESRSREDSSLASRLDDIVSRNLGAHPEFAGFLPADPIVPKSVALRKPACLIDPTSPFCVAVADLASRIAKDGHRQAIPLYEADDEVSLPEGIS